MKIFKTEDIRKLDEYTIKHEPISSVDLMERAATSVFRWYIDKYTTSRAVYIFCGNGNNGGDGLVLARKLIEADYEVYVYVLKTPEDFSTDARINYERLMWLNKTDIEFLTDKFPDIPNNSVVIDALFGSGLNRPLEGYNADLVRHINNADCDIISIDTPSGLFGENNEGNNLDAIIKATYTLSFDIPKLSFLFSENENYVGEWSVLPIGLHTDALNKFDTKYYYISRSDIVKMLKPRSQFAHKASLGKSLLIAGSYGMMGAASLAAKAYYKSGAGWLKVHVPQCGVDVMQIAVPEATLSADRDKHLFTLLPDNMEIYDAVGIGCGIGQHVETQNAFAKFVECLNKPIVLDADALNILAMHPDRIKKLPANSIITPHRGEFKRIVGEWENDYNCLMKQIEFAVDNKLIVVLKGAYTSVAMPDGRVYFNSTGNSGMATAGSGDVLAGVILGLLAQAYQPEVASLLGVYLHGLAGDIAKDIFGEEALTASDIVNSIGEAYLHLR